MDPTGHTSFADLPRLLGLAIAVVGGVLAIVTWLRRPKMSEAVEVRRAAATPATGKIIYNDAPTVRVVDSQRVDRIRKVAQLRAGEHIDVLEHRSGPIPRFRITVRAVTADPQAPAAHIVVDFGGTRVSCGSQVRELAPNEFVLPRTLRDEPLNVVFHYHERGETLDFMRIKLRTVDVETGAAELDVMQVSGTWRTG